MIKMAKKWQKLTTIRRKQISLPRRNGDSEMEGTSTWTKVVKGHFVLYTIDQTRFVFPIVYLNNYVFRELLRLSEEEFGLPRDGPIMLPCEAVFMEYVVSLIKRGVTKEMEKALLMSMAKYHCSLCHSLCHEQTTQQFMACGF